MKMIIAFQGFLHDESGAVTVDWVVLTGALVGLGLASAAVVSGGVQDLSGEIQTSLGQMDVELAFGELAAAVASGAWGEHALLNGYGLDQAHFDDWATSGGVDEEDILAQYNSALSGLDSWADRGEAIDALGAAEAALIANGYGVPAGAPTYAELVAAAAG